MNKMRNSFLVKIIGLVCTLALVLGTVYVPLSLSAGALTIPVTPDQTVKFGFENDEQSEGWNNGTYKDRGEDGFGLASYAFSIHDLADYEGQVLGYSWSNAWSQKGGYRLNNKDGVYRLDTNSTYFVKLKITFRKTPSLSQISGDGTFIKLGYGFKGALSGNNVTEMTNTLSNVAVCNGGSWTLTDISGTKVVETGNAWYDLAYVFTTPASFSGDNSLGFFSRQNTDFEVWMDDVEVTKLGSNTGVVLTKDEYNGETNVLLGEIGTDVELPTLDPKEEIHQFLGWYTDEDRTVVAEGLKFTADVQSVYSKWRAPVTITFVDALNGTQTSVSGYTGDTITFPADPVDTIKNPEKVFKGWYTTESYTEKYVSETFGSSNITVYAKWEDKPPVMVIVPGETITFGFEPEEKSEAGNNGEYKNRGGDGFGLASWTYKIDQLEGYEGRVLGYHWINAWTQRGGYRLNNEKGIYRLDTNSTYVVKFKITFRGSPTPDQLDAEGSYIRLGYGFSGALTDNNITGMSNVLSNIAVCNGGTWTVTDVTGTQTVADGNKWYDLTYIFTTPDSFSGDNSLGFFARHNTNFNVWMDDVQVTKLADTTGIVLAKDEYNATTTVMTGEIGTAVELPTLVGREEDHVFMGWYTDEDRTVSAEGLTYAAGTQWAYAKWRAPVTLTFVDALNGKEDVLNGYTGDDITFPADPVDTVNTTKKLFAGWYTTESYTEKYEETKFGASNITVYAKWQDPVEEFVQDFENYPYSDKVEGPLADGYINYTNYHYFSIAMDKIDDPTGSEKGKVVKFEWDPTMVKDPNDPSTYNATSFDRNMDGSITMGDYAFSNGTQYIMYFDYYVEDIGSQSITMTCRNAKYNSGWNGGDELAAQRFTVTSADKDGKWHTGAIVLTMKEKSGVGPNIHAVFRNSANDKAKVYLDNFRFVPVQVNQVLMTVNNNNGTPTEFIPVEKGAAVSIKEPTLQGRTFKGWYTDAGCTNRFDEEVYPKTNFTVYARWSDVPENFQNYPFDTTKDFIFGRNLSIIKGEGVGVNDNAAAKFVLDGDKVYTTKEDGTVVYWASRALDADHIVKINTSVADGEVYRVSFWYKGDPAANVSTTIVLRTASPNNVWGDGTNDTNKITVSPNATEWQKAEFLYYCKLKAPSATGLFVRFNSTGKVTDLDQLAIAYIDDFLIEKIDKPYVLFDGLNNKLPQIAQGKVGQTIESPDVPVKVGMKFVGWYLDKELTQPFTDTVYTSGMAQTVYAKYDLADNFAINFENMGKGPSGAADDYLFIRGGLGGVDKMGYNKSKGLVFDRGATTEWSTCNALFDDGNQIIISNKNKYYVTFKYCAQEQLNANAYLYVRTASPGNAWAHKHTKVEFENAGHVSIEWPITATTEVGRWYTGALILDTSKIFVHEEKDGGSGDPRGYAAVYMWIRGGGAKIAIDDVSFKKLPEGHQAYIVDNGGAKSVPSYVSGKIGTSFRNQLPRNPQYENHLFKNYFRYDKNHNQTILEDKDMVFTADQINLVTNWVRLHTVQDFEKYSTMMNALGGYGPADFDYKLYDAKAEGNSADNVTSGRYSIHRLGTTPFFESIQVLDEDLRICGDEKFTVTMKVKIGKHFHTDGAIKIVGCKAPTYAWASSGTYHPIAVIADIADGEWHEVSYTFSSVERYLSIQTPGYVEVFIDDVVIDRADPEMPVSTPPVYTEYVQALRDANGNLIDVDASTIDVGSIIDFSLYVGGFNILPVLVIGGGVLLVAAVVFVVLFVIKKRKANKV